MSERFDEAYYRRHYETPDTAVADGETTGRLVAFVSAYLEYIGVEVTRVLDLGCGLGLWRAPLENAFSGVEYVGVEVSRYLCERFGWLHARIEELDVAPADLVVCQGVLQYLPDERAALALERLASLSRSALYLEALTRHDWDHTVSQKLTDGDVHLREGTWYRERLRPAFLDAGGGVYLKRDAGLALFELEARDP